MLAPLGVNILVYRESNRERWRETDDLFFNHPLRQPIPSFPSLSPSRSFYFSSARSPSPLRSRILGQFVSHPLIHAGKRKAGRGRNSIFPAHCPREPGPEEKDIEQSAKEGNEFSNYPIGFVPAFSPFEHRSKKESKGRSNAIESKASAGKRERGGEGKSGKDFVRRNRVSSFFFFLQNLFSPSIPSPVAVFSPPTNGNDSLFIGRASRRDPISLAHHHCSRLSKIYPIDGIVPSPRLRAIHGA